MRDLFTEELSQVYGAGGKGKSPRAPKRKNKCKGRSGSGSGRRGGSSGSRGKGGSS